MAALRSFLSSKLSPKALELLGMSKWYGRTYLPQLIASFVIKTTPRVRGFGADRSAGLVAQLQNVNVLAPTQLCRIMTKYGSDKGNHGWHNYTTVYSALLNERRKEPLRVFELGLGSTNPQLASNMGHMGGDGRPGASLRGWRDIFPRSSIFGADIDGTILFQDDRIKTFYCDQLDETAIRELWSQPELQAGADVIVDDGLHTFEANVSFLERSLDRLHPGGIFVIEDIRRELLDTWCEWLQEVARGRHSSYEYALLAVPNRLNEIDNNLVVIRRPKVNA